jgi:O-antigen/teichoic acid export membrane protein
MGKVNQLKIGSILSYFQMGIQILVGILYTPLMIKLLGQSEYGLYNTVASTISMISILNLGFSSGYVRFYAKYKANDDREAINRLNGLYIIIFSVIGVIALFCGLFLTLNLQYIFSTGLTSNEYVIARILMLLMTVNLAVSFPMSVFQCIINAHEKFIVLKVVGMGKTVLTPLLTIPLLLLGYGSIGLVAVSICLSFLVDTIYMIYTFIVLKCKFWFNHFDKGVFLQIFQYTVFIAINIVTDQINWNIDKFILGRYCGTVVVAVYSVGATIQSYYQMFSLSVSNVFIPRVHSIVNNKEYEPAKRYCELTKVFIKVGRIQYIVLALVMTGFIFFGKEFIVLWAGEGYEESYTIALLLMLPVTIPLIQNIGTEIQRALNKHQLRSVIYLFMAFLNLYITVYLSQKYGAKGAALGTTISLILSTGIIMNLLYQFVLHINVVLFWKNIIRMSVGLIIPVSSAVVAKMYIDFSRPMLFIIGILLYCAIYSISMFLFGMNRYEKELIIKPIKQVIKLKRRGKNCE